MEKRQRVLLSGDTLVLASVRASLEANPTFEVIVLDASHAAGHDLLALNPDIVIFDTSSVRPQFYYDLIQQWAGLLIGINPDSNQVLLWTGQHMCELSVQNLVEVIHQHQSRWDLFKRG
jgi:hypothetical protein